MKILAIDIETSPHLVYKFGPLWKPSPTGLSQVIRTSEVICFSAKWVGTDKGTYPENQRPAKDGTVFYGGLKHDRSAMVHAAHDLLGQADVVLHFNGKRFDIPHLNREFLEHRLPPPPPYEQVDLMNSAKRFLFGSHRLQHIATELGVEGKVEHSGFDLWRRCLEGDEVAWRLMERYNRRDVTLLEEMYDILLPWITPHPNVTLYDGGAGITCPRCGSTEHQRRGYRVTRTRKHARYQCGSCGGFFQQLVSGAASDIAA